MATQEVRTLTKSSVTILRHSGTDADVVSFARQSTEAKATDDAGNRRLIRYLVRHGHTGPFACLTADILVECPVSVSRQWLRHGVGTRYCERSMRYVELTGDMLQYGGFTPFESGEPMGTILWSFEEYEDLLTCGYASEDARDLLPLGTMTRFRMATNMEALFNFLTKRMAPEAQQPIRELAYDLWSQLKPLWPHTIEAYEDYLKHNDYKLSKSVRDLILLKLSTQTDFFDCLKELEGLGDREREEVERCLGL